ncbi:hypothetical protein Ga0080574_TMP3589 [Salipiger abyssi]|uniref:Uncharacterized protein n=1 Tax=Salipiger abyssi TaxID=1250539 RepID=A0A1P8UX12_9RHOB|nr:hypothetical protein Ga0080574_TMP3589 [Salipiger abyssi]
MHRLGASSLGRHVSSLRGAPTPQLKKAPPAVKRKGLSSDLFSGLFNVARNPVTKRHAQRLTPARRLRQAAPLYRRREAAALSSVCYRIGHRCAQDARDSCCHWPVGWHIMLRME